MAFLSELASLGAIENYREYGTQLASNLGLGRLVRMAMRPLIDTVVATPLEWALNTQYRGKLLGVSEAVRAYLRGRMTSEQLYTELSRQGYTTEKINWLVAVNELTLTDTDLDRLVRWGVRSEQFAVQHLKDRGYREEIAQLVLMANHLAQAEARVREFMNTAEKQVLDGFISKADFDDLVENLPLSDVEKRWERLIVGQLLEIPRKQLTLGQMRQAFLNGNVDLQEWNEFLDKEGYSADDAQILTLELLTDFKAEEERRRLKTDREAERERKRAEKGGGTPAPAGTPIVP
jgi:hypothetical protein